MVARVHIVDDRGYRETADLGEITGLVGRENVTLWLDADERTPELEKCLLEVLCIHPLVGEDIFSDRLTPKVEDFGDFLYIVMHGVRRDAEDPEHLGTLEIDIVIGPNWVFTHHGGSMRSIESVAAELKRNPRLLQKGPAYLAHGVIDHLTDHYLPVVDKFEDEIDDVEKHVVTDPNPELLQTLFALKRSLQRLRRLSVYQRDILARLSRGEFERIPQRALPFFRDVYDHFVRISDLADSYRELVGAALEIYMSVTANRANEIMKSLALVSAMMLPLNFITGMYGMNFDHIPGLHKLWGLPIAIGIMVVIAAWIFVHFRRKKWL